MAKKNKKEEVEKEEIEKNKEDDSKGEEQVRERLKALGYLS